MNLNIHLDVLAIKSFYVQKEDVQVINNVTYLIIVVMLNFGIGHIEIKTKYVEIHFSSLLIQFLNAFSL